MDEKAREPSKRGDFCELDFLVRRARGVVDMLYTLDSTTGNHLNAVDDAYGLCAGSTNSTFDLLLNLLMEIEKRVDDLWSQACSPK